MSKFKSMATLIRNRRVDINMSQEKLSTALGYRNGQFISNVERGLCGIPIKKIRTVSTVLNITPADIVGACVEDYSRGVRAEILRPQVSSC